MQQAPVRLSQTLWSAFRAAKPTKQPFRSIHPRALTERSTPCVPVPAIWFSSKQTIAQQARYYSNGKSETDRKVEEAKARIDESLNARADAAAKPDEKLKDSKHETIVHTIPEASSIVYTTEKKAEPPKSSQSESASPPSQGNTNPTNTFLPSDFSRHYSHLRKRFTHFMDNYQTHIFTASQRINDLTGYSGIEALKKEIESLEAQVQESRRSVKKCRDKYSEAIATRSTTQREVNDLLHRKHTWTPTDLERFTSLYRSDHANEQAEAASQKDVADAEAKYEEYSTKLAKSILARYHEEQIWSDKIRQMSTWGTWGLMGLNVLLFVIFQIAVEPWRRRRLVKGFEEKVEVALKERDEELAAMKASGYGQAIRPNQSTAEGLAQLSPTEKVEAIADNIAEQIVDAIFGTTEEPVDASSSTITQTPAPSSDETLSQSTPPPLEEIEAAAETVTAQDLDSSVSSEDSDTTDTPPHAPPPSLSTPWASSRWTSPSSPLAWYEDSLRSLFSTDHHIMLTQRELTTVALEGVAGGMAIMGLLFVLLKPR